MGKILAVLSIVAAATTLAGCAAGQSKVDASPDLVHAMPDYANITNANLDNAADGVCTIFKTDESGGWDTAVRAATAENTATEKEAAVLVKAAVAAYCPQYVKDLGQP